MCVCARARAWRESSQPGSRREISIQATQLNVLLPRSTGRRTLPPPSGWRARRGRAVARLLGGEHLVGQHLLEQRAHPQLLPLHHFHLRAPQGGVLDRGLRTEILLLKFRRRASAVDGAGERRAGRGRGQTKSRSS